MTVKRTDLTQAEQAQLRKMAESKVKRKMKSIAKEVEKETKWAKSQSAIAIKVDAAVRDEVPVRIDSKTTVFIRRDRCVQLPDGTWQKKTTT